MASALIGGLRQSGTDARNIYASDLDQVRLAELSRDLGFQCADSNQHLLDECDVIILSVKPQNMQDVVSQLRLNRSDQLFISIAAGITIGSFETWFGQPVAIVRTMPNTPAMVATGATGMYASANVSAEQKRLAEQIMSAVGLAVWVDTEAMLDVVTAVSGSGPAYFFYMMQAIEQAGTELGLPADIAHQLTVQTALGAAKLAQNSADTTEQLRKKVTSPGGTTEAAINAFDANKGIELIKLAVAAARTRSAELAEDMEKTS